MQLWHVTIYRDDSTTPVTFEDVKHTFFIAGNTVLVIAQMDANGHHYIQWPRENFCWWKSERQ